MIHRPSRDKLALSLRRFVAGRIDYEELDCIEVDWRDRGATAVKQMAWNLYDDYVEYYASGKYTFSRENKREISRWILFLQSEREYIWPEYAFDQVRCSFLNLLTLGWWEKNEKRRWDEFCEAGDFSCWPFINKIELDQAISKPKFFSSFNRDYSCK